MSQTQPAVQPSPKGEAVWVTAEVGGVRSSDDSVPDLWVWTTHGGAKGCHLVRSKAEQQRTGDGPLGYQRHKTFGSCHPMLASPPLAAMKGPRKAGCGKSARPV